MHSDLASEILALASDDALELAEALAWHAGRGGLDAPPPSPEATRRLLEAGLLNVGERGAPTPAGDAVLAALNVADREDTRIEAFVFTISAIDAAAQAALDGAADVAAVGEMDDAVELAIAADVLRSVAKGIASGPVRGRLRRTCRIAAEDAWSQALRRIDAAGDECAALSRRLRVDENRTAVRLRLLANVLKAVASMLAPPPSASTPGAPSPVGRGTRRERGRRRAAW